MRSATLAALLVITRLAVRDASAADLGAGLAVNGHILYYSNQQPVAAVTVDLTGPASMSAVTDVTGSFAAAPVEAGTWTVQPAKLDANGAAVSTLDAVYILQWLLGFRTLSAEQQVACDVSGNGGLSVFDAVLILEYVSGIIGDFPVVAACGSDWAFVPMAGSTGSSLVEPVVSPGSCQLGAAQVTMADSSLTQDFTAIRYGDCTGNWQPATSPPPAATATPTASATAPPPTAPPATPSATPRATATVTSTASYSATAAPTGTPTRSPSPTMPPTTTPTWTPNPTRSPTPTAVATSTTTFTPTATPTRTPTASPTASPSQTASATASTTATGTRTNTPSPTPTSTPTRTPTNTPPPTNTPTASPIATSTATAAASATPSSTRTSTAIPTPSHTPVPTNTPLPASTVTPTSTSTRTSTPSQTPANTPTATPINTALPSSTATATATATAGNVGTPQLIGFVPGVGNTTYDIVVSGGLAFVASDPFGLSVVAVSTPAAPVVVASADRPFIGTRLAVTGTGPGAPNRAVVAGNTADLFAHLWIVDVSDAMHPLVVGELSTAVPVGAQSGFKGVAVDSTGTVAVVAVGSSGLWVLDLSNPALPSVTATYATGGIAYGVALNTTAQGSAAPGTLAYVAAGTAGLKIVDISDRAHPALAGSLAMSGTQLDIGLTAGGGTACLVSNTGPLSTVDVSTPSAPVLKRAVSTSGSASRLSVAGTTAAVLTSSAQTLNTYIDLFDVSTPAAPVKTSSTVVGASPSGRGLDLVNGLVYLAADSQGVKIYDASMATSGSVQDTFMPRALAVAGSRAVVVGGDTSTGTARLEVLDMSTPSAPVVTGALGNAAVPFFTGVALNSTGTRAVVSLGSAGIWVIDVTVPSVLGTYDTPGTANAVVLNTLTQGSYAPGSLAYVADGAQGLKILDISQPALPVLIGSLSMVGTQVDIALAGTIACVLSNTGPLSTVDVSIPGTPVFKRSVNPTASPLHLAASGSLVAVVSNNSLNAYLDIMSIADPALPTRVGSVLVAASPTGAKNVDLVGSMAYVAGNTDGLKLYDISAPANPTLSSTTPTVGVALAVDVTGASVYVADFPATVDTFSVGP